LIKQKKCKAASAALRFHLPGNSPTHINLSQTLQRLGHKKSLRLRAHITTKHLTLPEPYTATLEAKHLLAQLVARHCPHIMPFTLPLFPETAIPIISQQITNHAASTRWILKPALQNNAKNIHLFSSLSHVADHFATGRHVTGPQVLQQYVEPHLLNGHKYSLRLFMVLSNFLPPLLYDKGYFNVAVNPYQADDLTALNSHLTNEHLALDDRQNVWQIPTARCPNFTVIFQEIKSILSTLTRALHHEHSLRHATLKNRAFALFGMDFLVDEQLRVWLLEANHGPCFPIRSSHPLQGYLYQPFWQSRVKNIVLRACGVTPLSAALSSDFVSLN
jgi:hypothetical protein